MALWMGPSKSDFDCSMRHRRSDVLPMAKKSIGDDGRQIVPPSGSGVALIALRDGDDRRLCLLVLSADTRFAGRQQWTVFSAQRTICAGRHAFAISSPWAIESMMEDSGEKCKVKA